MTFLLLFCALLLPASAAAADAARYRIIRPSDEAHNLLPKTCRVCHKDETFRFFVVAAPDADSLDVAEGLLTDLGGVAEKGPATPENPHGAIACLFCHLETPEAGSDPAAMAFRTLDGSAAARAQVARLCELCHPGGEKRHPKVYSSKRAAAKELAQLGLPVPDGEILCSTCHEMHGERAAPGALRFAYLPFATNSRVSLVHGSRVGCRSCHPDTPAGGEAVAFLDPDPTARCTKCHDAAHGGIHPMAVAASEKTYPMDFLDYPLGDQGKLHCSTCHDHPCEEPLDPRNASFLRGGPYLTTTEFCYRCHPRAGLGSLNPHRQVDPEGRIVTTTCAFCHRTIPDPENPEEAYFGPEDLLFLHSPVELCAGCHEIGPHPTGVNHLVEMVEDRVAKLAEYEQRHRVKLPLDASNRVVCTTCHNPHAKGVLRGTAALGAGELNQWRVPSYAELCTPCHARYD